MKIKLTPEYDSDNSNEPDVTFEKHENGSMRIELEYPAREVIFSAEDWKALARAAAD